MNELVSWYTVPDKFQQTKIIATVGVTNEEVSCIAYHYGLKDHNLDGKTSILERLWISREGEINLHIANHLAIVGAAFDVTLMQTSIRQILNTGASAAISAAQFAYFQVLIGIPLGSALTAAGVTGIKKFVYKSAIEGAIKKVIGH